jgi:hypothetical protein
MNKWLLFESLVEIFFLDLQSSVFVLPTFERIVGCGCLADVRRYARHMDGEEEEEEEEEGRGGKLSPAQLLHRKRRKGKSLVECRLSDLIGKVSFSR